MYGSYMGDDQNIPRVATFTALGDVGAAFMASLFIVPTILVFELDLSQGPTLVIATLPKLFSVMPGGRVLGSCFLLALTLIAMLSAVGAIEAIVRSINEELRIRSGRTRTIIAIPVGAFLAIRSATALGTCSMKDYFDNVTTSILKF